jgi:uncharacterized protein (TIGR02246 family)
MNDLPPTVTRLDEGTASDQNQAVRSLYQQLLAAWNKRDATEYAALFAPEATVVGFDGSQMNGQADISTTIRQIFLGHPTPPYYSKIRSVRFLNDEIALLQAVVGMVPPGQTKIAPTLNAMQSLVAIKNNHNGAVIWRITFLQNTPAQFHGRPELVEQLTLELQQLLEQGSKELEIL